jgi:serine/threonine-protein kinase RsbW
MADTRALRVAAARQNLAAVRQFVRATLSAWRIPPPVIASLCLAVDEAAANVIVHGYKDQGGDLEVELQQRPDALVLTLRDHAPLFDPTVVVGATPEVAGPDRLPGGLGLQLIRQAVDEMRYAVAADGANVLTLIKILSRNSACASIPSLVQ